MRSAFSSLGCAALCWGLHSFLALLLTLFFSVDQSSGYTAKWGRKRVPGTSEFCWGILIRIMHFFGFFFFSFLRLRDRVEKWKKTCRDEMKNVTWGRRKQRQAKKRRRIKGYELACFWFKFGCDWSHSSVVLTQVNLYYSVWKAHHSLNEFVKLITEKCRQVCDRDWAMWQGFWQREASAFLFSPLCIASLCLLKSDAWDGGFKKEVKQHNV